ncbi:unnamed protein product, partial [Ectocarpus sp. 12 AP-2014]
LRIITALLSQEPAYNVSGFSDPLIAMPHCRETIFDLVIVDYRMPGLDGVDCVKALRESKDYEHVPIIMLTGDNDRTVRLAAISAGATDFLSKPFDPQELRVRVKNLMSLRQAQLALADRAKHLDLEVQKATRKLIDQEEELIWRLARAIELRDGNTGQHISRVARVSVIVARCLGMGDAYCRTIYLASPLHDTGKIGIPDAILLKADRLSPQERLVINTHIDIGGKILEDGNSELIQMAHEIALSHHEKWDGTGYGQGLSRDDIPLSARIVAIADVFDALCTERPYKRAWDFQDAWDEVHHLSGTHFDPDCVTAFEAGKSEIEEIYAKTNLSKSVA